MQRQLSATVLAPPLSLLHLHLHLHLHAEDHHSQPPDLTSLNMPRAPKAAKTIADQSRSPIDSTPNEATTSPSGTKFSLPSNRKRVKPRPVSCQELGDSAFALSSKANDVRCWLLLTTVLFCRPASQLVPISHNLLAHLLPDTVHLAVHFTKGLGSDRRDLTIREVPSSALPCSEG